MILAQTMWRNAVYYTLKYSINQSTSVECILQLVGGNLLMGLPFVHLEF